MTLLVPSPESPPTDGVEKQKQQHQQASHKLRPQCPIGLMVQYECQPPMTDGTIVCKEVERFFRMCPGRPAEEITHKVEFDEQDRVYEIGTG
ncbi:unnamed protein product [Jaminaea pallidilutea]